MSKIKKGNWFFSSFLRYVWLLKSQWKLINVIIVAFCSNSKVHLVAFSLSKGYYDDVKEGFFMFSTLYSLLTNEPQTTYHSSSASRPNHNFAHSAAQQQTAPVNLETVKNATTASSVVTNFAASNTSSSTTVAVVKPTFSAPSPTADNLKIESPATANSTTSANITNEKAERGISASEVTERSGCSNSSPKSLQHHASTTTLNQNNAKHFEGK